jgi:hypothetical protein
MEWVKWSGWVDGWEGFNGWWVEVDGLNGCACWLARWTGMARCTGSGWLEWALHSWRGYGEHLLNQRVFLLRPTHCHLPCLAKLPQTFAELDQKRVRSAATSTQVRDGFTVLRTAGACWPQGPAGVLASVGRAPGSYAELAACFGWCYGGQLCNRGTPWRWHASLACNKLLLSVPSLMCACRAASPSDRWAPARCRFQGHLPPVPLPHAAHTGAVQGPGWQYQLSSRCNHQVLHLCFCPNALHSRCKELREGQLVLFGGCETGARALSISLSMPLQDVWSSVWSGTLPLSALCYAALSCAVLCCGCRSAAHL